MNKENDYDVIIVGAGIAGLKLAKLFNNSDLNILLIEKRETIKKLVTNIFATPLEYVKKYNLQDYVLHKCDFGWYGTEVKTLLKLENKEFCAIDMNPWAKSLELKCHIKTETTINGLKRGNNKIIISDQNNNNYSAKIIVDCSGDAQIIGTLLGIEKSKGDFSDYACIFENANIKNYREMGYFQDTNLVNCGGWFHPVGKNKFLIGISEWTEVKYLNKEEHIKRMKSLIKNFYPFNKYVKWEDRIEEAYKIGPTTTLHSSIAEDNYLAVGDASGGGTPFIGLGFYTSLEMATSAYKTILSAFKQQNFSKKTLIKYSNEFNNKYAKWYKWSKVVRYIMLHYTTNKEINLMAKRFKILNEEEHYNWLLSYITPKMILKIMFGKEMIWFYLLKNAFRYHFLRYFGLDIKRRPLKIN